MTVIVVARFDLRPSRPKRKDRKCPWGKFREPCPPIHGLEVIIDRLDHHGSPTAPPSASVFLDKVVLNVAWLLPVAAVVRLHPVGLVEGP